MNIKRFLSSISITLIALILMTGLVVAETPGDRSALGTGFTYQGQLKNSGTPYTGSCDFHFALYDALASGTGSEYGSTTINSVPVTDGYFTVILDFGATAFTGDALWLDITVRCPATSGTWVPLTPRQPVTAAPYALYAKNAWSLGGNPGTTAGTNYLGTSDNQALEIKVNALRVFRFEPNATSPNLIGGYSGNWITPGVYGATISGGGEAEGLNRVTDPYGTVSGGYNNQAGDDDVVSYASYATVSGGESNSASSPYSTISGGGYNSASGGYATIGGGSGNTASNYAATIGGGDSNTAGYSATVGGGYLNTATGLYSIIPGGISNTAPGDNSFAAGTNANANSTGCFVWGDSTLAELTCSTNNRWLARASGGVYFYTNAASSSGMYLAASGSAWNTVSNRDLKENFSTLDKELLLTNLAQYPISAWNYKAQDETVVHVGMMADEFNSLIAGLGGEGADYINSMDAVGVALAAAQGLYAENQELKAENASQQEQIDDLEARLSALENNAGVGHASGVTGQPSWMTYSMLGIGLIAVAGVWFSRRFHGGVK